ncbi:MAG: hypothetical protein ACOC56_03545 [Atribacterota bacterium]
MIKQITSKVELNKFLSLSDLAYHKFCVSIVNDLTKDLSINKLENISLNVGINSKFKLLNRIIIISKLFLIFIKTHIQYTLFVLLFCIRNKTNNQINNRFFDDIKYIFISPLNNRNLGLIFKLFHEDSLHIYLPSSSFSFLLKINQKNNNINSNEFVMNPAIPSVRVLLKILKYIIYKGIFIQDAIDNLRGDKKYLNFHRRIYLVLVRHEWAKNVVKKIKKNIPNAIVILENDFGGNKLALVEEMNNNNIKNIHVQHGTYFLDNIEFIPPLAKFMFCCSERERKIQIQNGYSPENLFVYGQSFQTIKDSSMYSNNISSEFDIVILGSRGSKWRQEGFLELLSILNKRPYKDLKIRLRHDPAINEAHKKYWENAIPNAVISQNNTLFRDIQFGKIIITFSADAMITCLRQHKKTIYCTIYNEKNHLIYNFLKNKSFLRFADTQEELKKAINFFLAIEDENFVNMINDEFIDYNFGISDMNKIKFNFSSALNQIYNR